MGSMTHYPQINALHRAPRIQLTATPAVIKLGDGVRAQARLEAISSTGGLLQLSKALAGGDFVEITFQTHAGNVQGMAEMLDPVRSGPGSVFQPFRFVALGDDDHQVLGRMIESVRDRDFLSLRSSGGGRRS